MEAWETMISGATKLISTDMQVLHRGSSWPLGTPSKDLPGIQAPDEEWPVCMAGSHHHVKELKCYGKLLAAIELFSWTGASFGMNYAGLMRGRCGSSRLSGELSQVAFRCKSST